MPRAARNVGADLEDAGIELGHRADDAVDLLPFGDAAGDGVSSGVTCVEARELEKPRAPAFNASCTRAAMRLMSSSVASRSAPACP